VPVPVNKSPAAQTWQGRAEGGGWVGLFKNEKRHRTTQSGRYSPEKKNLAPPVRPSAGGPWPFLPVPSRGTRRR
jgi:hypothetical protein